VSTVEPGRILELSSSDLARAIRAKKVTSLAAMEAVLARADSVQSSLNCFVRIDREDALAAARLADGELARGLVRGPLHGVPMAHKDMYYRQGVASSCGSKICKDRPAPTTATALKKLDAAGAIQFGVLNMAEFAYGPTGHNYHLGHCRNPWNPAYITGGSSSGSGAAVAARASFAALGSDTGGSIRSPATFCGLSGIKPTWSRVSRHGAMPLSFSMDTVGPLARTVEDCALIMGVIAGADPLDPTASKHPVPDYVARLAHPAKDFMKGLRIGTAKRYFHDGMDPEIEALVRASLEVYAKLGAQIIEVDVPDMEPWGHAAVTIIAAEAAAAHSNWMRTRPQDYSDQVRARLEIGLSVPAATYLECLRLRSVALQEFSDTVFSRVDILHAPSVSFQTPTIAETDVGGGETMMKVMNTITRLARIGNFLGLPCLSVQAGFASNGMPTAVQLMGRQFDEATLFAAGHAYQQATDWHLRSPVK
jgi:aspartyl-tRNA(Asn)/glutamyl-tRNA(Gln) amidotransferase subunit A